MYSERHEYNTQVSVNGTRLPAFESKAKVTFFVRSNGSAGNRVFVRLVSQGYTGGCQGDVDGHSRCHKFTS